MDVVLYFIIAICIGYLKMKAPSERAVSSMINNPGEAVVEMAILPIGTNYSLKREKDAYTLILEELGLK